MKLSIKYLLGIITVIIILLVFSFVTFPEGSKAKTYNAVKYINYYKKCNHEDTRQEITKTAIYSDEQIKKDFPEYIANLNGQVLELKQNHDGYCPRHYLAYLKDNTINIVRLNDNFTVRQFEIAPNVLTESELKSLKSGLHLFDTYELTNFIEDYSS